MRDLFSKLMTGAMVAGAALAVAACGGTETANTADNTAMSDMNSTDTMMEGTTNDMTAVDGAMAGDNMAMDSNMAMDNASTDMNNMSNSGTMNNAM